MSRERRTIIAGWVLLVLCAFPSAAYALGLGGRPVLKVSPEKIESELKQGKTATVNVTVTNSGGRPMKWSFKSLPIWLIPSASGGTVEKGQEQDVSLLVDARSLPIGETLSEVVLEAGAAENSPLTLSVKIQVNADPSYVAPGQLSFAVHRAEIGYLFNRTPNSAAAGLNFDDNAMMGLDFFYSLSPHSEDYPVNLRRRLSRVPYAHVWLGNRKIGNQDDNWEALVFSFEGHFARKDLPFTGSFIFQQGDLGTNKVNFGLKETIFGLKAGYLHPEIKNLEIGLLIHQEKLDFDIPLSGDADATELRVGAYGTWLTNLKGKLLNLEADLTWVNYKSDGFGSFSWDDTNIAAGGWVDYFFNEGFSIGLGGELEFGGHPDTVGIGVLFRGKFYFNSTWSVGLGFGQFNNLESKDSFGVFPDDGSTFVINFAGRFR